MTNKKAPLKNEAFEKLYENNKKTRLGFFFLSLTKLDKKPFLTY